MFTESDHVNPANYALLPAGRYYTKRSRKVKAITMHVTAGLQDLGMVGTDESAEKTNRWALAKKPMVSWHRIADSDGVEQCLPSWFTAWHAKGYNSSTIGEEIANVDARWDNKPKSWVKWTIWWAAVGVADWVVKYKIPLRRATQTELDRAIANDGPPVGFIDHSRISPIRVDPGATFPWQTFFRYVQQATSGATSPDGPTVNGPVVTQPPAKLALDGKFGAATRIELKKHLRKAYRSGVVVDSSWDKSDSRYLELVLNHLADQQGWAQAKAEGTTAPDINNIHTSRLRWMVGVNPVKGPWTEATTLNMQKHLNNKNGLNQ